MIVMDARQAVIAAYRARRAALIEEARADERDRRPIRAAHKRQAARVLGIAIVSEEINSVPTGIVREEAE